MTNYYILKDNKIALFDSNKETLQNTIKFIPEFQGLEILETERPIENFQFADSEEYIAQKKEEERKRLDSLSLTAADVERAIYKVKGMDFDDVVEYITTYSSNPDSTEPAIDIKALKIELKANNFYRGNPYISQIGALLGFSEAQLDEFFETNNYEVLIND